MSEEHQHIVDFELLTRYLANELDADQQQAVNVWLEAKPENRKEFEELKKVWHIADNVKELPTLNIDKEWEVQLVNIAQESTSVKQGNSRTLQLKTILQIAASIVLLVALVVGGKNIFISNTTKTQLAETTSIELPDGSLVTLNGNSKITYNKNFGKENRSVKLSGEAFFEVQSNPEKPFIVNAGDASVKVLGTSFNVKAYRKLKQIEVTVAEGKVSVFDSKRAEKQLVLTPGESANYHKQTASIEKQTAINPNYLAWKTRVLSFNNTSLEDVINELENVYKVELVLGNKMLKYCTITVQFDHQELESVLKVLESTLDLKASRDKDKIIFNGAACQ